MAQDCLDTQYYNVFYLICVTEGRKEAWFLQEMVNKNAMRAHEQI